MNAATALSATLPAATPPAAAGASASAGTPGEFARCMERAADRARTDTTAEPPATGEAGGAASAVPSEGVAQDSAGAATRDGEQADDDAAHSGGFAAPDLTQLLPGWTPMPAAIAVAGAASVSPVAADGAVDATGAAAAVEALVGGAPRSVSDTRMSAAPSTAQTRDALGSDGATALPGLAVATPPSAAAARDGDVAPVTTEATATLQASAQALPAPAEASAPPTFTVAPGAAPSAAPAAKAPETALPTAQLHAPIDTPAFAPSLATQLRVWTSDGVQQAQLQLNPAEMGPVAVRIVIDGREARVDFSADVAATRSALESALPVLAAALDESGLKLTGGGVHDGAAQRQAAWQAPAVTHRTNGSATASAADAARAAAAARGTPARGLVDLVA